MDTIVINAPAKVNLFLRVLGKRPDGYHTIETLFEKIALFDRIRLQKASGINISSQDADLPLGEGNLAYKAARLLEERCERPLGVNIEIEKSIPIGAGLGGGSSDAAAVLVAMNELYSLGIPERELELLARELGADVPFFVSDGAWAVGRERGDKIESIDACMKLWHIFIIPPLSILSKEAYEWIDKAKRRERPEIKKVLIALRQDDAESLGGHLYNDLEGLSLERLGSLKSLKEILVKDGAKGALVSGSGPALFGIFRSEREVMNFKERMNKRMTTGMKETEKWRFFTAPTINKETNRWRSQK